MGINNEYNECDIIIAILWIFLFAVIMHLFFRGVDDEKQQKNNAETFGALQSLYSNDGIQDAYLTIENDPNNPNYYDPYAYWRGVTWDLPTRNLNRLVFYPYLYEYNIDRYGRIYPYW